MPGKSYRRKPIIIQAIQYTGDNEHEVHKWSNGEIHDKVGRCLFLSTAASTMMAAVGDYIIRGIDGEYYPCHPKVFQELYETPEGG